MKNYKKVLKYGALFVGGAVASRAADATIDMSPVTSAGTSTVAVLLAAGALLIAAAMSWKSLKVAAKATMGFFSSIFR